MTRVLVVLHGMGEHADGWHAEIVETLNRTAAGQRHLLGRGVTFDTDAGADVLVLPVRYDDLFDAYWQRQARGAAALDALAAQEQVALPVPGLWSWLARSAEDRSFLRTHVSDVVLYRYFPNLRQRVRVQVALRIAEAIAALPGGLAGNRVVFLAHSLGTAVLQQVLHQLATVPIPSAQGPVRTYLYKGAPLYDAAVMLANVSRALEEDDVHASVVAPFGAPQGGCLGSYATFRHALDPAPVFRPLMPADWGPGYHAPPALQHHVAANVHGWPHYLEHPAVHLTLCNLVMADELASPQEIAQATAAYESACGLATWPTRLAAQHPDWPAPCRTALEAFPLLLQTLRDIPAPERDSAEEWLAMLVHYGGSLLRTAVPCAAAGREAVRL